MLNTCDEFAGLRPDADPCKIAVALLDPTDPTESLPSYDAQAILDAINFILEVNPHSKLAIETILGAYSRSLCTLLYKKLRKHEYTRENFNRMMGEIFQDSLLKISQVIPSFQPNFDDLYEYVGERKFSPEIEDIPARYEELIQQGVSKQEAYNIVVGVYDEPIIYVDAKKVIKATLDQLWELVRKTALTENDKSIDKDRTRYGAKKKKLTRKEKAREAEERAYLTAELHKTTTLADVEIKAEVDREIWRWRTTEYSPGQEALSYYRPPKGLWNDSDTPTNRGMDGSDQFMVGSEKIRKKIEEREERNERIYRACNDATDFWIMALIDEQLPATEFDADGRAIPRYRTIEEIGAELGHDRNIIGERLAKIKERYSQGYAQGHKVQKWSGVKQRKPYRDFREQTRRCFLNNNRAGLAEAVRVSGIAGGVLYSVAERIDAVGYADTVDMPSPGGWTL